jgi:3,4-dihydroxy-2-butanone 4-phosphate synthase
MFTGVVTEPRPAGSFQTDAPGGRILLDPVQEALAAMAAGRAIIVVDDADRENEGDIIFAAEHATPALMGWAVRHSSGVLCVPLPGNYADRLDLPPMTAENQDAKGTAYTVSVMPGLESAPGSAPPTGQ